MYAMFLNVIKRMKFETNLVFGTCFLVSCGFIVTPKLKDTAVKKFSKQSIFSRGKCVINFLVY